MERFTGPTLVDNICQRKETHITTCLSALARHEPLTHNEAFYHRTVPVCTPFPSQIDISADAQRLCLLLHLHPRKGLSISES